MTYDLYSVEGLQRALAALSEEKYKAFNDSLIPGGRQSYGVRMPHLRRMAKEIAAGEWRNFLENCPVDFHEERVLKGLVIAAAPCTAEERMTYIRAFVPLIDNWAVCDPFCAALREADKQQELYWELACSYLDSREEYALRFAAVLMLEHFLNDTYIDRVLDIYEAMQHDGYYLKMAVAWGLSIAYIHYPEKTMEVFRRGRLDDFTHNKALQKCRESLRVSAEEKAMLQTLKRKISRKKV